MSEVNKKTVQEKLSELADLVGWFQGSTFSLEEAVPKFQQAEKLAEEIETDLTQLKNDIQVVKQRFDGDI